MNADLQPASQRPGPQSASSNLPSKTQTSSTTAFRLGVLFSEPLVWPEENGASPAIAPWDFAEERDLIFESLSQAGRALEVRLEAASMENLGHFILDGCCVLHYSGHGSPRFLPLEDDRGRAQAMRLQAVRALLAESNQPGPELVFIRARYASRAGELFRAAGIPNVVVAETDLLAEDRAATAFIRTFYVALASGKTISQAVAEGRKAIAAMPEASKEQRRFTLLDENSDHQVAPFAKAPRGIWRETAPLSQAEGLPPTKKFFLGRAIEIQKAVEGLLEHRVVMLHGSQGVGKTAVAVAAAHYLHQRRHFPDGVFLISQHHAWSHEALRFALAQSLGEQVESDEDLFERLNSLDLLLILDQCEDLLQHHGRVFLKRLLQAAPRVKLLLTSQNTPDNELQEVVEKVIHLRPLSRLEAAHLFRKLTPQLLAAELGRPASELMLVEALSQHPLLKLLAGHPFAISLAAPLLEDKSLKQLHDLLISKSDREESENLAELPDHETAFAVMLQATIDNLRQQQPESVRLLGLMAMLPGGASSVDIQLIWGKEDWRPLMETLVQVALIEYENGLEECFFIPPSIASYVAPRLSHADRLSHARQAAAHYAILCDVISNAMENSSAVGVAWLEQHARNLLACLDSERYAAKSGLGDTPSHVAVIASALPTLFLQTNRAYDAMKAAELGAQCYCVLGLRQEEAKTLTLLGELRRRLSDLSGARQALEQASSIFRELGDRQSEVDIQSSLGELQALLGDLSAAQTTYERALSLYRELNNLTGEAGAFIALGELWKRLSDLPKARTAFEQALPLYEKINDPRGEAFTLRALGDLNRLMGDLEMALGQLTRALVRHHQSGDLSGVAGDLGCLARCANAAEQPALAVWLAEEALKIFGRMDDLQSQALALEDQAEAFAALDEDQAFLAALWQALELQRRMPPPHSAELQNFFEGLREEMPPGKYQKLLRNLQTHGEAQRQQVVANLRSEAEKDPLIQEIRALLSHVE